MIGYPAMTAATPSMAAGSIVCFSSTVFHRSGPNTTEHSVASTSPSTPPSRCSTRSVHDHATSPARCSSTAST